MEQRKREGKKRKGWKGMTQMKRKGMEEIEKTEERKRKCRDGWNKGIDRITNIITRKGR